MDEPVPVPEPVPDYTDGTWYVPAGKNDYVKKPEVEPPTPEFPPE